jgi:hypothetical protein
MAILTAISAPIAYWLLTERHTMSAIDADLADAKAHGY